MKRDWSIFISSVFFVLGFSTIFSILGVLLQTVLVKASFTIQLWLSRIGGVIIILFALYLLKLIKIPSLEKEHKLQVKHKFRSKYLTSFVFGAAFAVGWTPCVGPILGAVLTLAVTKPSMGFFLLLSYSLGLGIPFLLIGLFTNQARKLINKSSAWIKYLQYVFGALLLFMGILIFTQQLSSIANLTIPSVLINLAAAFGPSLNLGIAFLAGLVSFLSPCVLPLVPAFLTHLASQSVRK